MPPPGDDRIIQVLLNLLSNAVKFCRQGTVTVRVEAEGPTVAVSVQDTGIGIPHGLQSAIFDRFTQVGDEGTAKKGTGLGLPICQHIVASNGGKPWVESTPGEGFTFTLPVLGAERTCACRRNQNLKRYLRAILL